MGKLFLGIAVKWWLILAAVAAVIGAGYYIYNNIYEAGEENVRTEITEQNQKLDEHVTQVNENITRRVVTEDIRINRESREVEEVINEMPSESLSNVSRARLERVREQQSVRETD